jgi:hypothetical protein
MEQEFPRSSSSNIPSQRKLTFLKTQAPSPTDSGSALINPDSTFNWFSATAKAGYFSWHYWFGNSCALAWWKAITPQLLDEEEHRWGYLTDLSKQIKPPLNDPDGQKLLREPREKRCGNGVERALFAWLGKQKDKLLSFRRDFAQQ